MPLSLGHTRTAVILAAGRGTRLGGFLHDRPKGFLPALDKTFITRAIDILLSAGVNDIIIVTGYGADHYEHLAAEYRGSVRTVYNSEFSNKGTMHSLSVALKEVTGSFMILDADIVYEARAVHSILNEPAENAIVISSIGTLGDEFLAWGNPIKNPDDRLLHHLSKQRADRQENPDGEHMGIMKFGPSLAADLKEWMFANPEKAATMPYENCMLLLLAQHPVQMVYLLDLVWTEVDTFEMYQYAQQKILPRLADLDRA